MFKRGWSSPINWFIPPELRQLICHLSLGVFAGGLFVFTFMHQLGALDIEEPVNLGKGPALIPAHSPTHTPTLVPTIRPVPMGTVVLPTRTPTPTPEPTLTIEEKEEFRMRWDIEHGGIIQTTVETSKKKKKKKKPEHDYVDKYGILQDSNQDGILEFSIPLLSMRQDNGRGVLFSSFVHICCGCALTHRVYVNVYMGPLGFRMAQRWEMLPHETHVNRVRKWGPNYRQREEFLNRPHPFGLDPISDYSAEYGSQ